jgi:hypothetical protein
MAGLGYKDFTVGQVLTSAEVDGYLMQQTIMVFASSAARTTALSGVLAEGMFSYLTDTNATQYYDGSAWVDISNPGDITAVTAGTGLTGGGTSGSVSLAIATSQSDLIIKGFEEDVNVVASAATGTINFDVSTASVWYYTSNASANHTLNFRYSSGATLSSVLAVGDAITVVFLNTNGATAYYPTVYQVDGSAVTPKWQGGTAPTSGNASSIDAYSLTIIKTASTPTYTVLASQTKFA